MSLVNGTAIAVAANVTPSFGVLLIGTIFCFTLWGISCMQLFLYYGGYPDDSIFTKLTIFVLWAFITANPAMQLSSLWGVLVVEWGSSAAFDDPLTGMVHHGWVAGVAIMGVQLFFLWRIYRLGAGEPWTVVVVVVVALLSVTQLATSAGVYKSWQYFMQKLKLFGPISIMMMHRLKGATTLSVVHAKILRRLQVVTRAVTFPADIFICVSLLSLLLRNGIPKYQSTRGLLYRSIIVTINSGLWTAVLALLDLLLMLTRTDFVYCIVEFPLSTLYFVTLLSNLNARGYIRGRKTEWNEYLSTLSEFQKGAPGNVSTSDVGGRGVAYVLSDFPAAKGNASTAGSRTLRTSESSKVKLVNLQLALR
ncbi:hypothetical protein BC629DRAFT_1589500 [Irpex lacteus]|nr:hypothetical protein BC629DRAFT_1589500 [Irpex lacteus]